MEFSWTDEQEQLRTEVREFLSRELPPSQEEGALSAEWDSSERFEWAVSFNKKLADRGWLTAHWPKQYGGGGMSILEQLVLREELAYRRAPLLNMNGVNMLGPILMMHGTEEQKGAHLPGIANVDVMWCQGYSEPNAGSDLASLETTAIRDGDDYLINGTKIWTGHAMHADWIFVLARTDPNAPKHKGISMFLMEMTEPGIIVQPLQSMFDGAVIFCQEFFDDVRVSRQNLVGEENRGWYVAKDLLNFERSNVSRAAAARRLLDDVILWHRRRKSRPNWTLTRRSQGLEMSLAERVIETEVGRLLSYRIANIQAAGGVPNHEASAAKVLHSEVGVRIVDTAWQILGLWGIPLPEDDRRQLDGRITFGLALSFVQTVAAGANEVQRDIIATRGLGLPRSS